ncbi:MAG: hypothetical protein AMXMBFR84_18010 [Candidatus Hydrogenedentota bacterium]
MTFKKINKVELKRREDLQDIDTELDAALQHLDSAVENIGRLLETIEKVGTQGVFAELPDEGEVVPEASSTTPEGTPS